MSTPLETTRFGSGRAVPRIEDGELLVGRGRFTDNVAAGEAMANASSDNASDTDALFVAFARSPYAHALITAIDTSAALERPGVIGVFTGADLVAAGVKPMPVSPNFKRADGKPMGTADRRALAHEVVRFVGEAVAIVVATTRDGARDAAEALAIDYDEQPAVTDAVAAIAPGAPVLTPAAPDNIAAEMRHGNEAATADAFARATHVVALDLVNQRLVAAPMEPRSVLARVDAARGKLVFRISSQMPTGVRGSIVDLIPGRSIDNVQVVVGDVGGGFGMKTGAYPEDVAIAFAACTLQRDLRWQSDRSEDFVSAAHGRDLVSRAELALDANGKALALRVRSLANVGGYATVSGVVIQIMIGPWVSTSIYDIPNVDLQIQAVMTHTAPTAAYRGAGRPEAIYIVERLFDAAARQLQLDPAELRRRNMIRPEQMPYKTALNQTYDSGRFEQILDGGLALADWRGFEARRAASKAKGLLRGRGIATFLEWTGGGALGEQVGIRIAGDGFIEIVSATQAMGQGIATSYSQLAVDVFEVPIDRIRIVQGDTDRANGFGSAGSRSLFVGGSAVSVAAKQAVKVAQDLAANALEAAAADIEYRAGRYTVVGTDLGIGLFELAARQPNARIAVDMQSSVASSSWPNACHVCEVEVDPATGDIALQSYASVNDIGRVVSPAIVQGQIEGGAMQGIGQALCEQVLYDAGSHQLVTGSFMDYAMPRAAVGGVFKTVFDTSIPCLTNPLGVKGVGELGTIGATPAIVNAVIDALDHAGHGHDAERVQMPLSAEKVWRALQGDVDASPLAGVTFAH